MSGLLWRIANALSLGTLGRMERKEREIKARRGVIEAEVPRDLGNWFRPHSRRGK